MKIIIFFTLFLQLNLFANEKRPDMDLLREKAKINGLTDAYKLSDQRVIDYVNEVNSIILNSGLTKGATLRDVYELEGITDPKIRQQRVVEINARNDKARNQSNDKNKSFEQNKQVIVRQQKGSSN